MAFSRRLAWRWARRTPCKMCLQWHDRMSIVGVHGLALKQVMGGETFTSRYSDKSDICSFLESFVIVCLRFIECRAQRPFRSTLLEAAVQLSSPGDAERQRHVCTLAGTSVEKTTRLIWESIPCALHRHSGNYRHHLASIDTTFWARLSFMSRRAAERHYSSTS